MSFPRTLAWTLWLGLLAVAQLPLVVEFPEGAALEVSAGEVVFDLSAVGFPPPQLPAYYGPSAPERLELRVFSNLEGAWALEASCEGLAGPEGAWLPADRLEVRLGGGPWLPLGADVVLWLGQGPTGGYRSWTLELRLRAEGDEAPGTYQGVLTFRLTRL